MKAKVRLCFLLILVLTLVLISEFGFVPTLKANPSWLSGWGYRKSHVINYATGAGANYTVPIIVVNATGTDSGNTTYIKNKTRTDFGDIRFTDNDETTLLDYWMEVLNTGKNATFWVEVADSLESAAQTIYIYYGKADATTTSSGTNTFPAWDDFDLDYSINDAPKAERGWTYTNDVKIVADPANANNKVMRLNDSGPDPDLTNTLPSKMASLSVHFRHRTAGGTSKTYMFNALEDVSARITTSEILTLQFPIQWYDGSAYRDFTPALSYAEDTWGSFEARIIAVGAGKSYILLKDGSSYTGDFRSSPTAGIDQVMFQRASANICYIDLFFVCKYVSPEPSHGAWGSEETGNQAPTNGAGSITDMDDTDNIYAQKKYYTGSSVHSDPNGYADIHYCEFRLLQGATVRARFQYHEDDNTFNVQEGSAAWDLDTGGSSAIGSGTSITVSWKFKPQWDAVEEADLEIELYVIDAGSLSDTDTVQTNYVDVVTRLVTFGFTVDDSRVNIGATVTISGTVYYGNNPASNTASSSYPPDAEFTSVIIHDSAHATFATDTTIFNGAFSVSAAIPSAVQNNTYHVYINMTDADYTDVDAVDGDTTTVIGDRDKIVSGGFTSDYTHVGTNTQVYFVVQYEFDSGNITDGTVLVNATGMTFSAASQRWEYNFTQTALGNYSYVITSVSGNTFGITTINDVAGMQNCTFYANLYLRTVDVEGNVLTGTVLYMSNGTAGGSEGDPGSSSGTAIVGDGGSFYYKSTSYGWANWTGITASSIQVYAKWYGLTVNATFTFSMTTDKTLDVNCACYPFNVSSIRYHVASNATISESSFANDVLTVKFSSVVNTYVLCASGPRPSYILNVTYDLDSDYTTYLQLTHYSNATVKVSYESWGGLYVKEINRIMTDCSWTGQKLSLTFSGQLGQTGNVEVYCASRGPPADYAGFSGAPTYSPSTKIFAGNYAFASPKTVTMNWETIGSSPTGGPSGPGTFGNLLVAVDFFFAPKMRVGTSVPGTISVTWSGPITIYVYNVKFGNVTWFTLEGLPLKLMKERDVIQGNVTLDVTVNIPSDAAAGKYTLPCVVTFQTETGQEVTVGGTLQFEVLAAPSTIPEYMTILMLAVIGSILFTAMMRKKRTA